MPEMTPGAMPEAMIDDADGKGVVRVGCADLPPGLRRERFFERLDYLETSGSRFQVPAERVLQRWRKEAGDKGRFGLLAPQVITDKPGPRGYVRGDKLGPEALAQAGGFRLTPVVERAVHSIAGACAVLEADTVVFRSPPDFSPSASNRDAMRRFFGECATQERFGKTIRVWEPLGLWEAAVAARFASELGVVHACDPLSNDPLSGGPLALAELLGEMAYFRITGLGRSRQRFDEYALEPLLELASHNEQTWIVFAHIHKYPDAIRCRQLVTSETA